MSKRRAGSAPARPDAPSKVKIVRIDVDDVDPSLPPAAPDEERIWVEATRGTRVLGVLEVGAGEHVAPAELRALAEADDAVGPPPLDTVASERLPTATVVVPTICTSPDGLVRTVGALLAMDHPSFDVVIVDNRTAATNAALPSLPGAQRVRVVEQRTPGISAARNMGTRAASGEVVAFTDDDAVPDPRWLRALCARFVSDPQVDAVGGLVLPMELDAAPKLWFEEFYGGFSRSFSASVASVATVTDDPLFPYAPGRFGAGCNMAFRRDALVRTGGFDEALGTGTPARGGEDLAMFVGLLLGGASVAFEPAALVRHSHRESEAAFFRQVRGYGVGLTAMYTALIVRDPRHLLEIAKRLPAGVRLLVKPRADRSVSAAPSYPARTLAYQVLGMATGPFAYARSARQHRGAR